VGFTGRGDEGRLVDEFAEAGVLVGVGLEVLQEVEDVYCFLKVDAELV
jgi:hypothetical protein